MGPLEALLADPEVTGIFIPKPQGVGLKREEIILHDLFVFQQTEVGPQGQVQGMQTWDKL